jgi:hypothetical protein
VTNVTPAYMEGRYKYARPEAMLWANDPGTLQNNSQNKPVYTPMGVEGTDFIILSDHNRSPIDIKTTRIEHRERMINGRMRSYHIADKLTISTSWQMLPSRAFENVPNFNSSTGLSSGVYNTVDGGAGGNELLDWYQNHVGSFWVYLSYDKYIEFGKDSAAYGHLSEYSQVLEMFISSFDYSIEKRGGSNFDLWNINVTLEEA